MRRDMELIRLLLLRAEGQEPIELSKYSEAQRIYHSAQLIDANLLRGVVRRDAEGNATGAVTVDLTWAGHDFLAAARSQNVWSKAMQKLKSTGIDIPLSLLKELLVQYSKQTLGLS